MNYAETLDYLYNIAPAFEKVGAGAYKEGLSNTHALDAHFGHPHSHYRTIHVAGTNGKGSTSHTLASILQEQGFKVGLYTSPHLVDFSERIRVNGQPVPHEWVVDFVERERSFFEPLCPSFFEVTTAMAFQYFAEQQVDIAVIEVGLGGRLDCTNIITPLLSIITNISLDHTQFLGTTLPQIAAEKAGIIKPGVPVVVGEYLPETRPVFEQTASRSGSSICFAQDLGEITDFGTIHPQLKGACQVRNTQTILAACLELKRQGIITDTEAVGRGFASVAQNTGLMGRWQTLSQEPLTICDTGHNAAGWQYLAPQIAAVPCRQRHIVFGMVDDKDIDTVLSLLPKEATYYFTQAYTHRAIPSERVCTIAAAHGLKGRPYPSVASAVKAAAENATPDDFIFIGGSTYVVADYLSQA